MSDLNSNNPITANGDYDVDVQRGKTYQLAVLGGTWSGPATLVAKYKSDVDGNWKSPSGGSFTADFEVEFIAQGSKMRFTVSGASGASLPVDLTRKD